jgi:hypothetical protein
VVRHRFPNVELDFLVNGARTQPHKIPQELLSSSDAHHDTQRILIVSDVDIASVLLTFYLTFFLSFFLTFYLITDI